MTREFDFDHDHWKDTMTREDRLNMRFPSAGASVSLGELSRGSFLPCVIDESSEIIVSPNHAYDLTLGKACRADAMQAYVQYLHAAVNQNPCVNVLNLERAYNSVIWACSCGIPQARMAQDLSNLRAYWLPRLGKNKKRRAERTRDVSTTRRVPSRTMKCVECGEKLYPNEEVFCGYCTSKILGQVDPEERIKNLLPVTTMHNQLCMAQTSMVGIYLSKPFHLPLPEWRCKACGCKGGGCKCKDGMIEEGNCWVDLGDEQYMVQGVNPLGERVFVYGKDQLVESVVAVIPPEESTKVLLAMTAEYGLPNSLSRDGNEARWTIYDEASVHYRIVLSHHLEDGKNGHLSITTQTAPAAE
jgi:hypothetical protein